jgi:hypothetical protein
VPRSGPLVTWEFFREGDVVLLAYRERGTGNGATIALTPRGATTLARLLEGTNDTESDEPARAELVAEVREHVGRTAA